jgi:hypothetical protein
MPVKRRSFHRVHCISDSESVTPDFRPYATGKPKVEKMAEFEKCWNYSYNGDEGCYSVKRCTGFMGRKMGFKGRQCLLKKENLAELRSHYFSLTCNYRLRR